MAYFCESSDAFEAMDFCQEDLSSYALQDKLEMLRQTVFDTSNHSGSNNIPSDMEVIKGTMKYISNLQHMLQQIPEEQCPRSPQQTPAEVNISSLEQNFSNLQIPSASSSADFSSPSYMHHQTSDTFSSFYTDSPERHSPDPYSAAQKYYNSAGSSDEDEPYFMSESRIYNTNSKSTTSKKTKTSGNFSKKSSKHSDYNGSYHSTQFQEHQYQQFQYSDCY